MAGHSTLPVLLLMLHLHHSHMLKLSAQYELPCDRVQMKRCSGKVFIIIAWRIAL